MPGPRASSARASRWPASSAWCAAAAPPAAASAPPGGRPLGWPNVLAGALLMTVPVLNRAAGTAEPAAYFFQVSTGLACGALLLCLWAHRGLVKDLTRPLPASR
ncbi:hypothetical protein LUX33_41530 [Actinomadura madurae]|nr:hypothetical protein [Actinomadura madurae]MCP9954253.1 hypothetical protein [Actinomadura madurae]